MALSPDSKHSQLFTVRVWLEQVDGSQVEWRAKVQRVPTGETLCFRDWAAMESFLLASVEDAPGFRFETHGKEGTGMAQRETGAKETEL